jgi:ferredoxin
MDANACRQKSRDPERSRLSCQIIVTEELDGLSLEVAPSDF